MPMTLMGKKRGMTQSFNKDGELVACTAIEVSPNVVVQIKESSGPDGYTALQLAFDPIETKDPRTAERRAGKPRTGHCKKAGIAPHRTVRESRVEDVAGIEIGQKFTVEFFSDVPYVDVTAKSKGKGFQGVMKRHNFRGAPASHGAHKVHRSGGSLGNRTTPGWVYPGRKMPGRMGGEQVTVQNLSVVGVDAERGLLLIGGAVPGARGDLVSIRVAKKRPMAK